MTKDLPKVDCLSGEMRFEAGLGQKRHEFQVHDRQGSDAGAPGKAAFCAGGDVKAVAAALKEPAPE